MSMILLAALAVLIPPVQRGIPNKQPALAAGRRFVAMVFGSGDTIWYARSDGDFKTFSKPVELAKLPGLMLGRHRGPRIAINGSQAVVTAVQGGDAGNLLAWRSSDGGKTWSSPVTINDVTHSAREGLQNLAVNRDGTYAAVWLDLRSPGTKLYGAFSKDGGKTWSWNEALHENQGGTICQCCHPSISADAKGRFEVMFRNVKDGDRDMYVMAWAPGKGPSEMEKQGTGSWQLNACPMDGGGVANWNGSVISAWRRNHDVFLAQEGKTERRLGEGKDVALALAPAGPVIAWTAPDGAVTAIQPVSGKITSLAGHGAYPVLQAARDGAIAAWEQGDAIATEIVDP